MTQIPRPILLLFLLLTTPFLSASVYTSITSNAHYNGIESDIYFYHGDHLGSASWITEHHGAPIQYIHYLPYGEILANQKASTYNERFKFTGKELDAESGYYFFNARYLLSELGNFLSVDPLSNKAPAIQPYLYCNGNPIRFIDPDGRDIYRYDEDGTFNLAIKTDDNFDLVGIFAYNAETNQYDLQRDVNGNPLTYSDHLGNNNQIAKGILSNGRNFQQNGGNIMVDGDGQPTTKDVQQFMLILDEISGKEISAYGVSSPYKTDGGMIRINPYLNNTTITSNNPIYSFDGYQVQSHFHTHGQAVDYFQATLPSDWDKNFKRKFSTQNPQTQFIILHNYGAPLHY